MTTPTTVRFRVGSDRDIVETVLFLGADVTTDDIRRKLAARGLTSPSQFPASAVHVTDVAPRLTADEIDQDKPQAHGHLTRTGHKLTGYYLSTADDGIVRLVRTCACAD